MVIADIDWIFSVAVSRLSWEDEIGMAAWPEWKLCDFPMDT
jgi:hypothetical protein